MRKIELTISPALAIHRLDVALAQLLPEYSRSQISRWIRAGEVCIEGIEPDKVVAKYLVHSNQSVEIFIADENRLSDNAEAMVLDIVYEDEAILVINKPAGLTVHLGAGQANHTLLNALLYHDRALGSVSRAGIVHRLDKLTSGLMVVAKTVVAQTDLVRQLQRRSISRRYLTLVNNVPITSFNCDKAIGRHPSQCTKMAVVEQGGKPAYTT